MQRRTTDLKVIKKQLAEAKRLHAQAQQAEATIETSSIVALEKAWQCGKRLNLIKESVGHGNWLTWLESKWPELGSRTAQRYMKIDSDNPNATRVSDLKFDTIRKAQLANVKKKEHPKEKGDVAFSKPENYSTVINEIARMIQRIDSGQDDVDKDELRKALDPHYRWMQRLFGDA